MTSFSNMVGFVGGLMGLAVGILKIYEFLERHKGNVDFVLLNSIYHESDSRINISIDCLLINKSDRPLSITDAKLFLYSKDGKDCAERIVETKHKTHDKIPYVLPAKTNGRLNLEFHVNEKPEKFVRCWFAPSGAINKMLKNYGNVVIPPEHFSFDGKVAKVEEEVIPLYGILVLHIESSKPHIEHIPINKKGRIPGSIDSLQLSQLEQRLCGELNEK